jgi:hypothetical protein
MGVLDPNSWASAFDESGEQAANQAFYAQMTGIQKNDWANRQNTEYQQNLQKPFYDAGMPAFYQLADAITGKRQTYTDPSYRKLNSVDMEYQQKINPGKYASGRDYYVGPDGQITDAPPQTTTSAFNPQETDSYKWKQQQMEKNTGRTLRSLGRSNSTYGMNVMADQNRNLASTEYDTQLGRLADLTNIARGGASSLASASTGALNNTMANNTAQGNAAGNYSLAQGMQQQNSLYSGQQNGMSLANLGMKAYDFGVDKGWWGGGSGQGALYDSVGGDINKVDFGSWGEGWE